MDHIYRSILIGIITIGVWLVASFILDDNTNTAVELEKQIVEKIDNTEELKEAFMQTLTIDYKGANN